MAGNKMSLWYALLISNGAAVGTTTLLLLCAAFVAAGSAQLLTSQRPLRMNFHHPHSFLEEEAIQDSCRFAKELLAHHVS